MGINDTVTKNDLIVLGKRLKTDMRNIFDDMLQVLDTLTSRIDDRFTRVETKLDSQVESMQQVLVRLDHIDKQLEIDEQERAVLNYQSERHETWLYDLAAKVGHKLSA